MSTDATGANPGTLDTLGEGSVEHGEVEAPAIDPGAFVRY